MEETSPLKALLLFFLCAGFSGVLSGIKSVIGFFQRQNSEHSLNGDLPKFQAVVEKATELWEKPGFFESLSLGRFILDGLAILFGVLALHRIVPELGWVGIGLVIILSAFLIAHWFFPMLAQAFSPNLGALALSMYRIYSFFFMGKLGELLFQTHDIALRKMGIDPKLSFLGEINVHRPNSRQDEENPDRSGLEEEEKEMIRSIFDLRETQVKEIMTPRVDMVALEINAPYKEVFDLVSKEKYSRIPVYKDSIDNVQGILHVMDLMSVDEAAKGTDFKLAALIRDAYFVPRTKKIGELMREFRLKHCHMAMVVDEYGGTSGLVTLEDILEEIVGEIHDEDEDETLRVRKLDEGVFLIDPGISLSDLNEELGINLRPDDSDTQIDSLGGFILFVHGKVPDCGDTIRFKDYAFEVLEMEGQKMRNVRLTMPAVAVS